jgi:hypothetical protein
MTAHQARIEAIYRYPVKGLSPQKLAQTSLAVGCTIAADRLYAIENGPTGFDPANPAYFPKIRFLMLMRNERLAALKTDYDEATHTLTIGHEGREAARGDLRTKEGRLAIEAFFRRFMPAELNGPPKVLSGEGAPGAPHSFSDVAKKVVSIINLASVAAAEWQAPGSPTTLSRYLMLPAYRPGRNLSFGARDRYRQRAAETGQAHRAVPPPMSIRYRHPRPDDPAHANAEPPHRLRICRGDRGRDIAVGDAITVSGS